MSEATLEAKPQDTHTPEDRLPEDVPQATEIDDADYAYVELMGHRHRYGKVQEVTKFGASMLRIDFYDAETDAMATDYYNPAALYCVSPITKAALDALVARDVSYRRPLLRQLPTADDLSDLEDPEDPENEEPNFTVSETVSEY